MLQATSLSFTANKNNLSDKSAIERLRNSFFLFDYFNDRFTHRFDETGNQCVSCDKIAESLRHTRIGPVVGELFKTLSCKAKSHISWDESGSIIGVCELGMIR